MVRCPLLSQRHPRCNLQRPNSSNTFAHHYLSKFHGRCNVVACILHSIELGLLDLTASSKRSTGSTAVPSLRRPVEAMVQYEWWGGAGYHTPKRARDVGPLFQRKLGHSETPQALRVADRSKFLGCFGSGGGWGNGHIQQCYIEISRHNGMNQCQLCLYCHRSPPLHLKYHQRSHPFQ